tara:strand:- start:20831 stop:21625 length:795 start_codon:yes stop_codon:yes gene_type:complete
LHAENALGIQSVDHPDGWGVCYYIGSSPHIIKADKPAMDCDIFKKVSGVVSSHTVLAHIRKSTIGNVSPLNTHPFQFGNWVFAHNGNIKNFEEKKPSLHQLISNTFKPYILGTTDSEIIFYIILSELEKELDLFSLSVDFYAIKKACQNAIEEIIKIIGDLSKNDSPPEESFLTFILTNGDNLIAFNGGKDLFYSTYKNECPDRDTCDSFAPFCEAPATDGKINHLLFSSEPLSGENIWIKMVKGDLIGSCNEMNLNISNIPTE